MIIAQLLFLRINAIYNKDYIVTYCLAISR